MTRKRSLTEEEASLFRETVKTVRPLAKRRAAPPLPKHEKPLRVDTPPPRMPVFVEREAEAISGHRQAHMRRGRLEPEARLDLHGMTQEEGFRALFRFLTRAHGEGLRNVLVITGKGGILRTMLPRWLAEPEFVPLASGIGEAHMRHGGAGAFYVAIRRLRDPSTG